MKRMGWSCGWGDAAGAGRRIVVSSTEKKKRVKSKRLVTFFFRILLKREWFWCARLNGKIGREVLSPHDDDEIKRGGTGKGRREKKHTGRVDKHARMHSPRLSFPLPPPCVADEERKKHALKKLKVRGGDEIDAHGHRLGARLSAAAGMAFSMLLFDPNCRASVVVLMLLFLSKRSRSDDEERGETAGQRDSPPNPTKTSLYSTGQPRTPRRIPWPPRSRP